MHDDRALAIASKIGGLWGTVLIRPSWLAAGMKSATKCFPVNFDVLSTKCSLRLIIIRLIHPLLQLQTVRKTWPESHTVHGAGLGLHKTWISIVENLAGDKRAHSTRHGFTFIITALQANYIQHVGKILISFKCPGTCLRTPQGHMVFKLLVAQRLSEGARVTADVPVAFKVLQALHTSLNSLYMQPCLAQTIRTEAPKNR
ncbi:hypothetical protein C8R44DRAFT_749899 [Mycena epipterygia]|nr:hypothetical protein C8R44DRAFT_749899 [Mycena epipterygia]